MSPVECADLLEQIRRYFSYLFGPYGFEVVHSKTARSGEHCLIVLQSKDCRIKFYRAQGEVNLLFGTLSAHPGWEDVIDGTRQWYYARGMIDFVEKSPVDVEKSLLQIRTPKTEDQQLAELSMKLEPVCDQVIRLFREDMVEQWRGEYERFEQERNAEFRRQFEELNNKTMQVKNGDVF